jgi:hypothetical protein
MRSSIERQRAVNKKQENHNKATAVTETTDNTIVGMLAIYVVCACAPSVSLEGAVSGQQAEQIAIELRGPAPYCLCY